MTTKPPLCGSIALGGLLAATVLISTACNGSSCVQVDHPPVTDPQTPLIIGGTYSEALSTMVGTRSGPMQWRDIEPPFDVEGLPPPGETRLTVTVYEPSMAEQIDHEKEGYTPYDRLTCSDWVEADVELELHSDDGLLDARIPAMAILHSPVEARVVAGVIDQDLGDLELMPMDLDSELSIRISYYAREEHPRATTGTLTLRGSSSDGDGSGAGWSDELATWTLDDQ